MTVRIFKDIRLSAGRFLGSESLRAKATRGGLWLGGASVGEQASRFTRNMLLARLLAPSSFGAMAIVLSSSSLIASLSDVGMWPAVIHHPQGGDDKYLNAAWWMGLIRAVGLYLIVFIAAPWIANFYGNPELSGLFRLTLVGTLFDGLLSPRAKLAHKEMRFARHAVINNGGAICGVILTIILAFLLRNVWALAIGFCAENAFRCILSYILYPGLASFKYDREAYKALFKFSRGMFGLSFLNLIFARTDIFVIGKMYSASELGLYTLAVNLAQTPASFLINTVSSTLLPAFSRVQTDRERGRRILSEVTSWTILLGLPAVATIGLCAPSLLRIAYGGKYSAASSALVIACGVAILNLLNSLITTQFFAIGRPELHRRAVAASAITMAIACYPACLMLGPVGGQAAAMLAIMVGYGLQISRSRDTSGAKSLQYGKAIPLAALVSVAVVALGIGVQHLGLGVTPVANIGIAFAACLLAYLCYLLTFDRVKEVASS